MRLGKMLLAFSLGMGRKFFTVSLGLTHTDNRSDIL